MPGNCDPWPGNTYAFFMFSVVVDSIVCGSAEFLLTYCVCVLCIFLIVSYLCYCPAFRAMQDICVNCWLSVGCRERLLFPVPSWLWLQRYQFYRMPDFEPAVMPNNHLFCGEIAKFTYLCQPTRFRPYSLMGRISDSGSDGCGSIPHGGTRRSAIRCSVLICYLSEGLMFTVSIIPWWLSVLCNLFKVKHLRKCPAFLARQDICASAWFAVWSVERISYRWPWCYSLRWIVIMLFT